MMSSSLSTQILEHVNATSMATQFGRLLSIAGKGIERADLLRRSIPRPLIAHLIGIASVLYLVIVYRRRFARVKALKKKFGFTKDPSTFKDMTIETAQEIEKNLAEWDMPFLFEFGWIFNFFATAAPAVLSKTIIHSGHFTNKDPFLGQKRQEDTIVMMSAMMAYPLQSYESAVMISRINEHHGLYGNMINSDTVLYLIWLFGWGPVETIDRYGWRKLQPFEKHAMWIFWRELALRLGCKYVPHTIEEMTMWKNKYRKQEIRPHPNNRAFADAMKDTLLLKVPAFAKGFLFQCMLALLDEKVVWACQWDDLKWKSNGTLAIVLYRILRLHAFLQRNLVLPRRSAYIRTGERNEKGLFNFEKTTYSAGPFYVKATPWSKWGPAALINRARGFAVPCAKYFSDGATLQSMGAQRGQPQKQAQSEENVVKQSLILFGAPYGYRALVKFQPEPLVPGFGLGYGSRANAYAREKATSKAK